MRPGAPTSEASDRFRAVETSRPPRIGAPVSSLSVGLRRLEDDFAFLDNAVGNLCNAVNPITGAHLTIPSRSITILGSSYTTFPGFSAPLFPNVGGR